MASKKARLGKFFFSTSQSYILEIGEYYIRFYMNEGQIVDGVGDPVEVITPYVEADIFDLDIYTQSADVLYIFHHTYPIGKLTRTDHDAWAYTTTTCGDKFNAAGKYPNCGCFFEQRLWVAGTDNEPQTLWGSLSGSYEDFTLDAEDPSAGVDFQIVSGNIEQIRWMFAGDFLVLGTVDGIWKIYSTISGEPLSQENINVKREIHIGVSPVHPEMVDDAVMFVTRMGTTVRRLAYSLESDRTVAHSLMRVASHIAKGATQVLSGITQMAYQKEPFPILWAVRTDGQLLGMVYDIQEKVYGWFRVMMDGIVESVNVIGADGEEDQIWIIVKRTIGITDKRYIEYFMPHNFFSAIKDCFFVHSGLTYSGVPATLISGLDHLEGKEVYCLGTVEGVGIGIPGIVQGPYTVTAGDITLGLAITYGHIGLTYDSTVEPMKLHVPTEQGTSKGKKQKINKLTASFHETGQGIEVGPNVSNLTDLFLNEDDPAEGALFTGDKDVDFEGNWETEATIVLRQSLPLPMTLLALIPRLKAVDED